MLVCKELECEFFVSTTDSFTQLRNPRENMHCVEKVGTGAF